MRQTKPLVTAVAQSLSILGSLSCYVTDSFSLMMNEVGYIACQGIVIRYIINEYVTILAQKPENIQSNQMAEGALLRNQVTV